MASKCKKKWLSTLHPTTGGSTVEKVIIIEDINGKLRGAHESGQGVTGNCLETGMTWTRPDDGTFPQYHYYGDFEDGNEDRVVGSFAVVALEDAKLTFFEGGDWEADKTT